MSVTVPPTPATTVAAPAILDVPIHRLTVQQYEAMIEAGILTEDDRVELLEGWLVATTTRSPLLVVAAGLVLDHLRRPLPSGWFRSVRIPVATTDSMPEPDVTLIRGAPRDYVERRPTSADIGLAVEVADTSLEPDRGLKKRLYARAGIVVYWIVNLIDRQIEVYTDPTGPAAEPTYRQRRDYGPDDAIPLALDGREVASLAMRELLP